MCPHVWNAMIRVGIAFSQPPKTKQSYPTISETSYALGGRAEHGDINLRREA